MTMTTGDIEKRSQDPMGDDPPGDHDTASEPGTEPPPNTEVAAPYSVFSERTKWFIVTLAAVGSICS